MPNLISSDDLNLTTQPLGTASWLNTEEAVPNYTPGALWLGRKADDEPAGYTDDRHVLLVSGTRAGKGVSIIIPNLCLWPGSAVVIDPKGENAMVTARRRANGSAWSIGMGQRVHILDPFGEVKTQYDTFDDLRAAYNPIDLIRQYTSDAIDESARIADALVISENSSDPFFEESAKQLIKSLILHIASANYLPDEDRNLLTLRHMLLSGDDSLGVLSAINGSEVTGMAMLFRRMKDNPAYGGLVARSGASFEEALEKSPRTLMSFLQVARTNTGFLDSEHWKHTLGHSTFALADIKRSECTVYLCLPQRYAPNHTRWLRMMVTLILGEMERVSGKPKHPVLMILDEFPALKRMVAIENAAAQIAGYGVKLMFVAQTLAQLKDTYKDNWETLVANAGIKLFFGNDDHTTRKYVADLIGETEVRRWTRTISHTDGLSHTESTGQQIGTSRNITHGSSSNFTYGEHMSASFGYSSSESYGSSRSRSQGYSDATNETDTEGINETIHKRYLITPDEVGRLFGNRNTPTMLVLTAGAQPSAVQRKMYHADASFGGFFDPHPDYDPPKTLAARNAELRERSSTKNQKEVLGIRAIGTGYAANTKLIMFKQALRASIQATFVAFIVWLVFLHT